jgi:hypothetical protein
LISVCEKTTALICLDLQLSHHFIEDTGTTDVNATTLLVLLVLVQSNCSTPLCYCLVLQLKLKLIYDRQSVGQSVLVSGAHLGPVTNFSFSLKFILDSCGCVIQHSPTRVYPLSREVGSVFCVFCQYQSIVSQYVHKVFT